ncbi:uncharacterized protein PHALS_00365 [Plasmopara halstedii]|uniref:Uncharacterized protein n=1 Tax=Plasmopara halstedii TaxID=4781 RepID=A0A0P1A720_PLAHL|nr:uncharacterized protein PHALS_00365 [Plasmopara halstedii]CEG36044.1 hypothetical protein PHALS_00365 [Plasmopara halstedii]|eukprot:XP_024572413.1 hypothetical protein PHALS_00365 [Plasmopara halstedii]
MQIHLYQVRRSTPEQQCSQVFMLLSIFEVIPSGIITKQIRTLYRRIDTESITGGNQ